MRPASPDAMRDLGFHTITLGCKLNQFDTAAIEGELDARGYAARPDPSRADVVIVNTCTVTHKADADARRLIRSVRRSNPDCRLLVTGCYAESDAERIRAIGGVDRVFGNRDKPRLAAILDELDIVGQRRAAPRFVGADRGCDATAFLPRALHFGERSRAFLKVQEGCRLACSYCIIPTVRGPSRSVLPAEVLAAARRLAERGYHEIVLTGVNTGDYGRDLTPATDLVGLLRRLLDGLGPVRLRLNSLEPLTVTDDVVALMAGEPRLAPHLQVPLQSGSPEILRAMRRNYRLEQYRERLTRLREAVPHAGLGADVIVGFPGEDERRFEETYRFIADSPLNYLHVFSWSPRPGTPASELRGRVHPRATRERSRRLRALAARLGHRFRRGFEGRTLDAVTLGKASGEGSTRALTGNFIEVRLRGARVDPGQPILARIERAGTGHTLAVAAGRPTWAGA